jgi:hypothetical protein
VCLKRPRSLPCWGESNPSLCCDRTPRLGGSLLAKFAKARQKARARAENTNSNTAPERERAGTSPNQRKNQRHHKSTELRSSEVVHSEVPDYRLFSLPLSLSLS